MNDDLHPRTNLGKDPEEYPGELPKADIKAIDEEKRAKQAAEAATKEAAAKAAAADVAKTEAEAAVLAETKAKEAAEQVWAAAQAEAAKRAEVEAAERKAAEQAAAEAKRESTTEPTVEDTLSTPATAPHVVAPEPFQQQHESLPKEGDSRAIHGTLRTIKYVVITLLVVGVISLIALGGQFLTSDKPSPETTPEAGNGASVESSVAGPNSISCVGTTGPDATTTSQSFVNIEGTDCTYRSGPSPETLVISGKLTGRNTEGTGMSVTINVNGKDCTGGETLNYSRAYTPMVSNCTFDVPANSSVAIRWRFLSPFGGSAAVLRSSKNIAPSITGVAIPKVQTTSASATPNPRPQP